ncbi:MAG: glycine zipper 2TM domain-containing protein [Caulobacteraceae bacterium]
MKVLLALASSAVVAAPCLALPAAASAQPYHYYGHYDPCRAAKRAAGHNGAVTGGIVGAVLGSAIAGRGSRFGGAVVGGTVGAVAGHEIGRHSVRCLAYPPRFRPRRDCHWVEQDYRGRPHQFELCRDRHGVWRPSGRRL